MLKQKLVLSYVTRILIQIFQIIVTIVVARIAGASVLGTIAFATSFVSVFTIFFDFGQGVAHIKLVSEGKDEGKCNTIYTRIQLILSGLFFIIAFGFFLFSKFILKETFESEVHEQVILLTIFTISISNLFSIPRTIFNARVEQAKADLPELIKQIIYQLLRLTVVLLGYAALAIAWTNLIATVIIIPIYLYLLKGTIFHKWDGELFKKYISISIPVFLTNIVDIIGSYSDKILLQYFYNSQVVGIYVAGFSIGGFISLIGSSSGLILLPTFSKDIKEENYSKVSDSLRKFERFTFFFIFPFVLVSSIGSDLIVALILGTKYLNTVPILSIVNISSFIVSYTMIYGVILSSKGLFKLNAKIYLMKLFFFILISFLLIHPNLFALESKGMALAILFSNLFLGTSFIFFVYISENKIKILPERYMIIYSLIYFVLGYFLYNIVSSNILKFSFLIILLILFWAIGFILKIFNKNDLQTLKNVISPLLLKKYITKEIKSNET